MKSIVIAAIVFVCVFGGAMVGTLLHGKLPQHHRDGDSKDVIKLVMGLIATIAALVLGLLIASAHTAYDTQESEVRQLAVHLALLDRILAHYGPEAAPTRAPCCARSSRPTSSESGPAKAPGRQPCLQPAARVRGEDVFGMIAKLSPAHARAALHAEPRALQLLTDMANTRRLMAEQAGGSLSWPFFVVLVFWLVVLFLGFGLFARFNATVFAAFFVGAISVAGAIFLILEMYHPYGGLMQISSLPMQQALAGAARQVGVRVA